MPWIIMDLDSREVLDREVYDSYEDAKESPWADLDDVMIVEINTPSREEN